MKNVKLFKMETEYETAKSSFNDTVISYTEDTQKVWFYEKINRSFIATYKNNIGNETKLLSYYYYYDGCSEYSDYYDLSNIKEIYIDGVKQDEIKHNYNLGDKEYVDVEFVMIENPSTYKMFSGCTSLTSVEIPSSVTSISNYAFSNCSSLTSVTIPSSVTSIGESAFYSCDSLTSIEIPSSVTSIGESAFYSCDSLTSIEIPSSVTSIGSMAFSNCYFTIDNFINNSSLNAEEKNYWSATIVDVITEDGLYIKDNVVIKCKSNAMSVTIPSSVTSIGDYAFKDCTSLTSVTFEEGSQLTSIGYYTFSGCTSLTSVEIPSSVTSISNYAFSNCSSLTSVEIPSSVTSIGYNVFSNCSGLTSVTFEEDSQLTSIGGSAFGYCSSLTSIEIPSSVTSIGNSAFSNCSGLTSIEIPSSVTSIGNSAFSNCSGLTSVTFEEDSQLTSIGGSLFDSCTSLTSIEIPSSVTSIGFGAFGGCDSLTSITCLATTAPNINSSTFNNIASNGVLKVPQGSNYSSWMSTSSYYLGYYNWRIEYI